MAFGPRRFFFLPEVGDEVLVAFLNGGVDLRQMAATARQKHPQQADFGSVASQAALLAGLVKQGAGRRVIDCEGYAYLTAQLLQ